MRSLCCERGHIALEGGDALSIRNRKFRLPIWESRSDGTSLVPEEQSKPIVSVAERNGIC